MYKKIFYSIVIMANFSIIIPVFAVPIVKMDMDILTPGLQRVIGVAGGQNIYAQLLIEGDGINYQEMKLNVSWDSPFITLLGALPTGYPQQTQFPWSATPSNPYPQSYFYGGRDMTCFNNNGGVCAPFSYGDVFNNAHLSPANGFAYSFGGFDISGYPPLNPQDPQGLGLLPHIDSGTTVPLLWIAFNLDPRFSLNDFILFKPSLLLTDINGLIVEAHTENSVVYKSVPESTYAPT